VRRESLRRDVFGETYKLTRPDVLKTKWYEDIPELILLRLREIFDSGTLLKETGKDASHLISLSADQQHRRD
jgi:hypothetical protein